MTVGLMAGQWCAYGLIPDLPGDQRYEAGGSLVFDSEPLTEATEILGAPLLTLELESDQPVAMIAGVLSEVLPDGAATRISFGLLNLTHRDSHEYPEPLEPGKRYTVTLQLNDCGHKFEVGNRIRIALSDVYWPIAWPAPEKTILTLSTGDSTLTLPLRPTDEADAALRPFEEPEAAAPLNATQVTPAGYSNEITHDIVTGRVTQRQWTDEGTIIYEDHNGWTVSSTHDEVFSVDPNEPQSAEIDITWTENFSRGAWEISSKTRTQIRVTATHFIIRGELSAHMGDELVHEQVWNREIPRDLV